VRISELATDPQWWPTVARLRAFRGVDTLTAFAIHLASIHRGGVGRPGFGADRGVDEPVGLMGGRWGRL